MDLPAITKNVMDVLAGSERIRDWCTDMYGSRCMLQYGEDAMDMLRDDEAPWIVVCPTEVEEHDQTKASIGMVAIGVALVDETKTETALALDLVTYQGVDRVIEFARMVRDEALTADFLCSRPRAGDMDFLVQNQFPLFTALTGIIVVEPEIVARATAWRQKR